jgi:hypothetical protein
MAELGDQGETRLAVAALFASLVEALRERDESLPSRFDAALERIWRQMRDYESSPIGALETLKWTSELMKSLAETRG